ncbi:hypothetical protein HNQ60_003125 [Povalibacter uvarum]|uniref:Uncharacterized protein n=1 Tax=Povalibacter uvarum TaxID=732238 RepID=A0A841HNP7_9GAMM|nr:hypothetical protein [Povalibacter uvarum]MBB6094244.1 hypothetical protein [Povalibacter uvarum]
MSDPLAGLYRTLELNGVAADDLPAWFGEVAFSCVDESTLDEIVSLLGSAKGEANQAFWSKVHHAPRTEEGWQSLQYIGGELTAETAQFMKRRDKEIVELIRRRFPLQEQVIGLFHK